MEAFDIPVGLSYRQWQGHLLPRGHTGRQSRGCRLAAMERRRRRAAPDAVGRPESAPPAVTVSACVFKDQRRAGHSSSREA